VEKVPFVVVTREDLAPVCPYCEARLEEVYRKATGIGFFLFARSVLYFCPSCRKVLGAGQSSWA